MNISKIIYSYQKPYRVVRHIAYWCFWLGFYGLVNSNYHQSESYKWFLFEIYTMIVKIPFAYFIAYFLFPKFLPEKKYLLLIFSILLLALIGLVILMLLYQLFPFEMPNGVGALFSAKTLYMYTDLLYIASPVVLIKITQRYIKEQKNAADLKHGKLEAELKVLKNQLQPHFLFNNLNNIYSMVLTGNPLAAQALLKLSDLLSYMLYECNIAHVPLSQEIALIKNYLELEKMRYANRLEVSFDTGGGSIENTVVAPLLFLPFVENAFKHGIAQEDGDPSWIRISLEATVHELVFIIENLASHNRMEKSQDLLKSGIGLTNIKRRLDLLYPSLHTLQIMQNDTYFVKLKINL